MNYSFPSSTGESSAKGDIPCPCDYHIPSVHRPQGHCSGTVMDLMEFEDKLLNVYNFHKQ